MSEPLQNQAEQKWWEEQEDRIKKEDNMLDQLNKLELKLTTALNMVVVGNQKLGSSFIIDILTDVQKIKEVINNAPSKLETSALSPDSV